MKKEINQTVELWASQISNPIQDNGDWMQSIMASLTKSMAGKPTEQQIELFKATLAAHLTAMCAGSWDEDEPKRGAASRTLSVDYDPCDALFIACQVAGISTLLLPIKSTTWTNPGKVSHRFGYSVQVTDVIVNS